MYDGPVVGWRDITGPIVVKGVGANDPTWDQIGSGPFYAYNFALNDECWIPFHIPHDIVPINDDNTLETIKLYFHTHWITDGTNTNTVKWQFTFSHARGFGQEAFDVATGTVVTAEEAASGTAYTHMVTETSGSTIANLTEPDGILYMHLKRITNGGTDNTDNIYVLTSDIHYLSNSLGTYSKSPSFYTEHE